MITSIATYNKYNDTKYLEVLMLTSLYQGRGPQVFHSDLYWSTQNSSMDTHPLCDQTWQLEVPELYMEAFSANRSRWWIFQNGADYPNPP